MAFCKNSLKDWILRPYLAGILSIFPKTILYANILLYMLISWFWLVLSNSFNILRLLIKCHLSKFTFMDFPGLSLLQISVQIQNSMQISFGSVIALFELRRNRNIYCSLHSIGYFVHFCQMWGSERPPWLTYKLQYLYPLFLT